MTDTTQTQDPYAVLKDQQSATQKTTQVAVSVQDISSSSMQENPPVQNTNVHISDWQSIGDTIIKVIVDIIARITGQPSPTGGKLPTLSQDELRQQTSAIKNKVWNTVTGWLANVGNKLENAANTAVQSAGSVVQQAKETAMNTANQAASVAKEQAQSAVDAAKVVGQSAVNVAKDSVSDVVDTAKNVANEAKEVANTAVDSAKNIASEAKDSAKNITDTSQSTIKKDPML